MKIWQMIRSHLLWLLSAGFLGVLFFASSTDLLITEQSSEVSRISVILDDVSDVNYENFRKGAEQGDEEALSAIGSLYFYGDGVEQDYLKALEYWEKAAEMGSGQAYYSLGFLYGAGLGVEKSLEKAKEYYLLAADHGDAMAWTVLGNMSYYGEAGE